jgi:hypothetical protein
MKTRALTLAAAAIVFSLMSSVAIADDSDDDETATITNKADCDAAHGKWVWINEEGHVGRCVDVP